MKLKFTCVLLIIAAAAAVNVLAQQPPAEGRAVLNEDGGEAFIIESGAPLVPSGHGRKLVNGQPEQCSVFLGSEWAASAQQPRETQLQNLLAHVDDERVLAALEESGVKNRFGPTASVVRSDISSRTLSDTDIQRLLATMLDEGTLPRFGGKTIYVVFLDSTLQSTLGALVAGKHYSAYYSIFRSSGSDVRYVVVPFQSGAATTNQVALRALLAAASNPASPN